MPLPAFVLGEDMKYETDEKEKDLLYSACS